MLASNRTHPEPPAPITESDTVVITYADQVTSPGELPLRTLDRVLRTWAAPFSTVHILPFFPFSSDDGFSVIDYLQVRPDLGSWEDVEALSEHHNLMIDAVINHVSAKSPWFLSYLAGDFDDLAITPPPDADLTDVVRPRTSDLLTEVMTSSGPKKVWTTFSPDQIDLNYAEPEVLLRVLEVLIQYARRGARFIRLDAATYLWKEIGTGCANLPQAHALVQIFRAVLDLASPQVLIITETNVPHEQNISYLAPGGIEAQLAYNFALPPLIAHALTTQSALTLTDWANGLKLPKGTAFFNFLASHDGIGLRGAEGILTDDQIATLAERAIDRGGYVSMGAGAEGRVPYELNINYLDMLSEPNHPGIGISRFLAAHAIALSLAGMPGIYLHSLLGSRSDRSLAERTNSPRAINRAQLDYATLAEELSDESSERSIIHRGITELLRVRANQSAFHPASPQVTLDLGPHFFGLLRGGSKNHVEGSPILCVHNVTGRRQPLPPDLSSMITLNDPLVGAPGILDAYGYVWLVISPAAADIIATTFPCDFPENVGRRE
ncbi:MAG: sugar phosphorylase [Flaviflexus sp.]|nr:sugar phosphorylase [Flaviflexus sp.]